MTHYNAVLSQLLKFVPKHEFESLAKQYHCGRQLRKTSGWAQFLALNIAQLSGRFRLRDIEKYRTKKIKNIGQA